MLVFALQKKPLALYNNCMDTIVGQTATQFVRLGDIVSTYGSGDGPFLDWLGGVIRSLKHAFPASSDPPHISEACYTYIITARDIYRNAQIPDARKWLMILQLTAAFLVLFQAHPIVMLTSLQVVADEPLLLLLPDNVNDALAQMNTDISMGGKRKRRGPQ